MKIDLNESLERRYGLIEEVEDENVLNLFSDAFLDEYEINSKEDLIQFFLGDYNEESASDLASELGLDTEIESGAGEDPDDDTNYVWEEICGTERNFNKLMDYYISMLWKYSDDWKVNNEPSIFANEDIHNNIEKYLPIIKNSLKAEFTDKISDMLDDDRWNYIDIDNEDDDWY